MEQHLLFHEPTRVELQAARESLVVLPVGATEQHGPHLPVGTDLLFVESIARGTHEIIQLVARDLALKYPAALTDSPAAGTAANGDAYLAVTVEAVARAFVGFFHAANNEVSGHTGGAIAQ